MFNKIIEFKSRDAACDEFHQFADVTFLKDFGPVKAGEQFAYVSFGIVDGLCTCWQTAEDKAYEFPFTICAPL